LSFNFLQKSLKTFSWFCISSFDSDIIINMYQNIKSRIVYNNAVSDFFDCNNGVRQGENLSPFLFSIYLNDLEQFLNLYLQDLFLLR
jgi:hypothetical protein